MSLVILPFVVSAIHFAFGHILLTLPLERSHLSFKYRKFNTESKLLRFGGSNVLIFLHNPFIDASVYGPLILFFCFY